MHQPQHPEVWDWRTYILKHGPDSSTARHVLLTLSCYMSSAGDSCFPSLDTLEEATQLSRPTLVKHLKKAKEDGWLEVSQHGYGDQRWKRNEYRARVPDEVIKAVSEVDHEGGKADLPPSPEGGKPALEGGKADGEKAVKEVNSTSPSNTTSNSSERDAHAREGERAVDLYRELTSRSPTTIQSDWIKQTVDDIELWEEVVRWWGGRGYRHANVQGMCEKYNEVKEERREESRAIPWYPDGLPETFDEYEGPFTENQFWKMKNYLKNEYEGLWPSNEIWRHQLRAAAINEFPDDYDPSKEELNEKIDEIRREKEQEA